MLRTFAGRVAAGAVISAALTIGSLSLTATAASAASGCTDPNCIRGVPPMATAAMECTNPRCISGSPPAAAPRPGAAAGTGIASVISINCPPPNPQVRAAISDC